MSTSEFGFGFVYFQFQLFTSTSHFLNAKTQAVFTIALLIHEGDPSNAIIERGEIVGTCTMRKHKLIDTASLLLHT